LLYGAGLNALGKLLLDIIFLGTVPKDKTVYARFDKLHASMVAIGRIVIMS